ncbi:tail sheath protein [Klebsiella phage CPRSB]|nr:tail sheath protein [Klebsiella phage CPRSB]
MALISPGIETKETSVQSTVVRNSTGRAAIVGKFSTGGQLTRSVRFLTKSNW